MKITVLKCKITGEVLVLQNHSYRHSNGRTCFNIVRGAMNFENRAWK